MGENGILKQLQKAMLERILEGEITTELRYKKHDPEGNNSGNSCNGYSEKTIKCTSGELPIQVPRDRNGEFLPHIIYTAATVADYFLIELWLAASS